MPVLSPKYAVREVCKSYGDKKVLSNLDFEVYEGRSLVVLGRSGSGKSVLLRLLNGLEKPDSGSILFDGTDIVPLAEKELYKVRRHVGMLFQGGALFDSMSIAENLAFPLERHGFDDPDEVTKRVSSGLERVGLAGSERLTPADLSGGMRKRAALARSLMLEPEVVLYDEPTTGLDPVTSANIGRLIRTTQQSLGVTSIVVTHDIPLARRVGDRVAFLHQGHFIFIGPWSDVDRCDELREFLAGAEVPRAA